jgi:nuclear transport factor 2 (NTF2) superfamily protein
MQILCDAHLKRVGSAVATGTRDEYDLMQRRFASINDLPIKESERKFTGRLAGVRMRILD